MVGFLKTDSQKQISNREVEATSRLFEGSSSTGENKENRCTGRVRLRAAHGLQPNAELLKRGLDGIKQSAPTRGKREVRACRTLYRMENLRNYLLVTAGVDIGNPGKHSLDMANRATVDQPAGIATVSLEKWLENQASDHRIQATTRST